MIRFSKVFGRAATTARKGAAWVALGMLTTVSVTAIAAPVWNPWSVGSAAPVVSGSSVEFVVGDEGTAVWSNGQTRSKDFYSTSVFNGASMGSLAGATISYTITAPPGLVGGPPNNGLSGPYVNIVVTNGLGGFSYLLMDASPAPLGQQSHGFSTAQYSFNETNGLLAAYVAGLVVDSVHDGKNWYDFSDIASLTIAGNGLSSNSAAIAPTGGWTGFGLTDSFLLVSGNRGSSPVPDITIDGVAFVPEPGSLALLGLGLVGLAAARRRAGIKA